MHRSALLTVALALSGVAHAEPKLACVPVVGAGSEIKIAGKTTEIIASNEPEKYPGSVEAWPYDDTHVLMAWSAPGHYGRPDGSDLLLVDCKAPKNVKTFWKGDFGHSITLSNGKMLFSNGEGRGIGVLDIAAKRAKGLTYPPTFKPDSAECDGREPGLHDIIVGLDDNDVLEFERGGSCGFEGDWDSTRYFVDHATTQPSKPRRGLPVAMVASGGDTVWAARATCDGSGAAVWTSADVGATWTKHAVAKALAGVDSIVVDAKQPGRALVQTATCVPSAMGMMPTGSRLHATSDGGATWRVVALPDDLVVETQPATIASTDGSLDHLALWGSDADNKDAMWTSSDTGAHWKRAPKAKPLPTLAHHSAQVGDATLRASTDGVVVKRGSAKTTRVYPYKSN